jgi:hypothetical protein
VAAILAMLFLVLIGTLSLGFYASTTTSVQVADNARYQNDAQYAAESGLQFISYQLRTMTGTLSNDPATIYAYVTSQLSASFTGSENMRDSASGTMYNPNSSTSGTVTTYYAPGSTITAGKATPHWMRIGTGAGTTFVMVQLDTSVSPARLLVTSVGKSQGATPAYRALQYTLSSINSPTTTTTTTTSTQTVQVPWAAPNGSIVTYSAISASNGARITGSVMALPPTSQTPATVTGGAAITGTLSYPAGYPSPVVNNGGSIASTSTVASAPAVPSFDTTAFAALVPASGQTAIGSSWLSNQVFTSAVLNASSQVGSSNIFTDIRIKANSNLTFGNGAVLNGVIYIESPNKITFGGGAKINGVIVSDNSSSSPYNSSTQNNTVTIANGVSVNGTSSIDMTKIPSSETAKITSLKDMFKDSSGNDISGSMILTPNYGLNFQGGMTVGGASAIVGSQFTIANGSAISLSGVLLNLGNSVFNVGGGMSITKSGLPVSWPGTSTSSTQTVTTTGTTTVASYTVALTRSTYSEIDPWQFVK